MDKKRTRLEVIRDILEVIRAKNGKIKPTHILYKSNLSYSMMEQYIQEMVSIGLIKEIKLKKGKTFGITEKGVSYLSQYSMIKDFTESFGLD